MHYTTYTMIAALALIGCACKKSPQDTDIISQTYIHKYGYAVSQKEWEEKNYPGQVVSCLRNGITITATYEGGVLHGPSTFTHPHSKIIGKYILFNLGDPVKEVLYDTAGMPKQETIRIASDKQTITCWYADGVPRSVEEYVQDALMEGQYFNLEHDLEAQVIHGKGTRTERDMQGMLVSKEEIEDGFVAKKESFYASGSPESTATYLKGKLHGIRQSFTEQGEPVAIENFSEGNQHGLSIYFKNGHKDREVPFVLGQRNGLEIHFLDGETVSHQITWVSGFKHGLETFFLANGVTKTLWNYNGKEVSQARFEELTNLDAMVSEATP